jgi:hypothetical protein
MNHAVNWEAISAIGQIVGALAVVISLIYLAREVRRNARAARQVELDNLIRWLRELAAHPHLRELYYRGLQDFESLEGADLIGFSVLMNQLFYLYQEMYHQQLEGRLNPRVWGMAEAPMRDINAYPGVQAWWRSRSHWFPDDFAKHVNELQQTAKAPRLLREPMEDE